MRNGALFVWAAIKTCTPRLLFLLSLFYTPSIIYLWLSFFLSFFCRRRLIERSSLYTERFRAFVSSCDGYSAVWCHAWRLPFLLYYTTHCTWCKYNGWTDRGCLCCCCCLCCSPDLVRHGCFSNAGKSTTISMLTGQLGATSGDAVVWGRSVRESLHEVLHDVGVSKIYRSGYFHSSLCCVALGVLLYY